MNVSTHDHVYANMKATLHNTDLTYREPRITNTQLMAMKCIDIQAERQKITLGAWLEEQINDLVAFFNVLIARSKSNCATRGHRVSVQNSRIGSCKCADCGANIATASQILQHTRNAEKNNPIVKNAINSAFWLDEAAIDRKITNRKKQNACWRIEE